MEIDPFDERELYGRQQQSRNEAVSTTISTIVVQGGPLQLVIALLRVREIVRHYNGSSLNIAFHPQKKPTGVI